MHKLIIITMLIVSMAANAQNAITYESADSVSYQCHLVGDWDKLINFGNEAILQGIEFKTLYQRMGYAYFMKRDYYAAQSKYKKALSYDHYDEGTRLFLYYCGLNIGDNGAAQFHAGKLPKETQLNLGIKPFKIVDAVDMEYNYKVNLINTRSNPNYYRLGISTKLSNRLSLYQAVSNYAQTESNPDSLKNKIIKKNSTFKNQTEYYTSLNWQLNSHVSLMGAYHYLNATVTDTTTIINTSLPTKAPNYKTVNTFTNSYVGNIFFAKVSVKLNRFNFGFSGSSAKMNAISTQQFGVQAGVAVPGAANIYLESALYSMVEANNNRLVFSQSALIPVLKNVWLDGKITLGNLKNYSENNGLYFYNSQDETTFRSNATLMWKTSNKITIFTNYGYDNKLITNNNINYNQHSFTTGLIWKL